jgi:hypothetical protein
VTREERTRRWQQLADIYLAAQLSCYPPDYLSRPTVDRVLEMIEKFEEDLTDKARLHGKLKVVLQVGHAIEVSPERDKRAEIDPLMVSIQTSLQGMIDELAAASPLLEEPAPPAATSSLPQPQSAAAAAPEQAMTGI